MQNDWEQFPPIEGNEGPGSGMVIVVLFAAMCFAVGFIAGAWFF